MSTTTYQDVDLNRLNAQSFYHSWWDRARTTVSLSLISLPSYPVPPLSLYLSWRKAIMSHPDLFSHFVLERPSKEDGNEEEMHLALKKLLRHSALSNHRLKSVDMNLFCFDRDLESICDSWESTEFSMIFDLLASPNSTHKRLHLRLPWLTNHWVIRNLQKLSWQSFNIFIPSNN